MAKKLEKLTGDVNFEMMTNLLNDIVEHLENMPAPRDRGPKSERVMTDKDARQIMLGDCKNLSHRAAAEKLGLSYGQVYSARNGYTFRKIHEEASKTRTRSK